MFWDVGQGKKSSVPIPRYLFLGLLLFFGGGGGGWCTLKKLWQDGGQEGRKHCLTIFIGKGETALKLWLLFIDRVVLSWQII